MLARADRYIKDKTSVARKVEVESLEMFSRSFELPPSDLKLTADEIHVWFGVLDQPVSEIYRFIQTLSKDECIRAGRFHFHQDRERFIARHGILRMLLGCYMGVEPSTLRFYGGKNGKPEVAAMFGKETIHFNLSHSEGAALFAFARSYEIGVDIEQIRDVSEMEQIVNQFFSVGEKTFFCALPQDMKREAFLNCWTRKEAFIKAIGEGLSWPLDKFNVTERNTLRTIEGETGGVSDWSIHSLKPACEHVGALAVRSKSFTLRCFKWMTAGAN